MTIYIIDPEAITNEHPGLTDADIAMLNEMLCECIEAAGADFGVEVRDDGHLLTPDLYLEVSWSEWPDAVDEIVYTTLEDFWPWWHQQHTEATIHE